MRRNRLIASVVAGVTLSAGAGWAAASTVKSPAQVAADKEPPSPSPITAPVERRSLATTVTGRGTVRFGEPETITLAASTYRGQGSSLVTKPATKGAVVGENAVVMEVNGRPVRTLVGATPMYRDIKPGDRGEDVRQLEAALQRLGFRPGKVDGVYDASTAGAVEAWYRASGFEAAGATDDQREKLRNAHSAVSNAESALLQARDALDKVRKGITAKDVRQAENDVRARARDLERATDELRAAQAAESLARAAEAKTATDNKLALARAAADVTAADHRVEEADLAEEVAKQKLEEDEAAGAPESQLDADRLDVERAENAHDEAETNLDNAKLAEDAAKAAAAQATRQAELATLQAAQATVAASRAIDAARDASELATTTLALVQEPPDEHMAKASLEKAERDLADARAQERELASETGIVVPANEVLFFPTLPLRVDESKVERGDDATKEVMVVTTSRLAVDGALSIPDARLVHVGDEVELTDTQLGVEAKGTVSKVASKPGTDGVDAQLVYVEVIPHDAPDQLIGASVAMSISVKTTKGKVLAVPVAAVTVNGSGDSRVRVVDGDRRRTVPVRTGLAAEGYVEVVPTSGKLEPGDRVLVGSSSG